MITEAFRFFAHFYRRSRNFVYEKGKIDELIRDSKNQSIKIKESLNNSPLIKWQMRWACGRVCLFSKILASRRRHLDNPIEGRLGDGRAAVFACQYTYKRAGAGGGGGEGVAPRGFARGYSDYVPMFYLAHRNQPAEFTIQTKQPPVGSHNFVLFRQPDRTAWKVYRCGVGVGGAGGGLRLPR